jgi:hypothetical protein
MSLSFFVYLNTNLEPVLILILDRESFQGCKPKFCLKFRTAQNSFQSFFFQLRSRLNESLIFGGTVSVEVDLLVEEMGAEQYISVEDLVHRSSC